jgi:hypothetical protein
MLNLFSRETFEVYCQNCGRELTESGGMVTSSGNIYCQGYREDPMLRCHEEALFRGIEEGMVFANYRTPKQVQKEIRKGELKNFRSLEEDVSD